jgi:hypothetical protein
VNDGKIHPDFWRCYECLGDTIKHYFVSSSPTKIGECMQLQWETNNTEYQMGWFQLQTVMGQ